VLAACNASVPRRLAIEVAPSCRHAERLLAATVIRLRDAYRRQTAIGAMGEARLIAVAGIEPRQNDAFGDLYLIGPEQNPLAYVRVRDASPGVDGVHPEHWLSVPPHMATAREAVAWTFGMSERAYAPAAES
jgi:hypothetical protein